ncbi:DUF3846 domain-containing protein [Streptomyces sp. B27]|uniref:DUF3846 domain-containing protein n=1 Tax=Streptomyces sp. B27 TaxID=2485015 RepID=UPI000FDB4F29|nr:DUF3846 domain-containing protein [Streptomyces sp. B27]
MTTEQKNNHALILRTNGEFEIIDWPTNGHLEILYRAIECDHVDAVTISPNLTMWIDDDGLNTGAPINRAATILYALHKEPHQHYVGNVVITGGADHRGDTLALTKDEIAALVEFHLTFTCGAPIPTQRTK